MSRIYRQDSDNASGETEPFKMDDLSGVVVGQVVDPNEVRVGDEVVDIERKAYEEGFSVGEKAGFELGAQKAAVLFNGVSAFLDEVSSQRETLFKACESEMLELIFAITRKVIEREVEVHKDIVVDCVRTAIKMVVADQDVLVKVNPKDLDVMQEFRPELSRYTRGEKGLVIESDSTIHRGGAKIESNFGEIDATIDGVMEEIESRLRDAE